MRPVADFIGRGPICRECRLKDWHEWTQAQQAKDRKARAEHPIVYVIRCEQFVKIGISTQGRLASRLKTCQVGNPFTCSILCVFPGNVQDEQRLHARLAPYRRRGEWFEVPETVLQQMIKDERDRIATAA